MVLNGCSFRFAGRFAGASGARADPSSAEKVCAALKGYPAADCFSTVAVSYVDRLAAAACGQMSGPALTLTCVRSIVGKRYTQEEILDCATLPSQWEEIQCLSAIGRSGGVGGCNVYGCWVSGGGCNTYGCWVNGGGCSSQGCWYGAGGGCNYNGCWHSPTGGCNTNGCWRNGGGCNAYGCWHSPAGKCNSYGCSDLGECTVSGCPK